MTVEYLDPADYVAIAAAVTGLEVEVVMRRSVLIPLLRAVPQIVTRHPGRTCIGVVTIRGTRSDPEPESSGWLVSPACRVVRSDE